MTEVKTIKGLSEVFSAYDGFIFDLWGVVHDGVSPSPDTIKILELLKKTKKPVWLLSNSHNRIELNINKLTSMGITPDLYSGITTAGEITWHALKDIYLEKFGKKCFSIGSNQGLHEGLDINLVEIAEDANFVLNALFIEETENISPYIKLLEKLLANNLPMICSDPDEFAHDGDILLICPGFFTKKYEEMGGNVINFGKPYKDVYSACFEGLKTNNILAVGDGMITDIKGATGAGIDSVLVTSGIHRNDDFDQKAKDFFNNYPYNPSFIMKNFTW